MKVAFHKSMKKPTAAKARRALERVLRSARETVVEHEDDAELVIRYGIAGATAEELKTGRYMLLDKGYFNRMDYLRVAFRGLHSWHVLASKTPDLHRLTKHYVRMTQKTAAPYATKNRPYLLLAGTSQKFCDFAGLGDCTEAHAALVRRIRAVGYDGPIRYRPKPSWRDKKPIDGTEEDKNPFIDSTLQDCWACVTVASNAALDAWRNGVAACVVGPGLLRDYARGIVPTHPVSTALRQRVFCAASYLQWRPEELSDLGTWRILRKQHDGTF